METREGGYLADSEREIREAAGIFDGDRPINHIPKIELVRGDIRETAPKYLHENRQLVVRILSLSMNLYEPTLAALDTFLPRMPKGAVIMAFAVNLPIYPGMTQALLDRVGPQARMETPAYYSNVTSIYV